MRIPGNQRKPTEHAPAVTLGRRQKMVATRRKRGPRKTESFNHGPKYIGRYRSMPSIKDRIALATRSLLQPTSVAVEKMRCVS